MLTYPTLPTIQKVKTIFSNFKSEVDFYLYKKTNGIYIAKNSHIDKKAKIGKRTRINAASHIGSCSIGSYCAIAGRLIVRSSNHHTNYANLQQDFQKNFIKSSTPISGLTKGEVSIGNACWIGDSVIILPGVSIGDGAVIGAGSIVTKNIPAFSVAAGNPAKIIRERFPKYVISFMMRQKWWEWDDKKIIKNKKFFEIKFDEVTELKLKKIEEQIQ